MCVAICTLSVQPCRGPKLSLSILTSYLSLAKDICKEQNMHVKNCAGQPLLDPSQKDHILIVHPDLMLVIGNRYLQGNNILASV